MPKLSTAALKSLISTWLNTDEARENISHHWEMQDPDRMTRSWQDDEDVTQLEYKSRLFGFMNIIKTPEELGERIWKMWCDGSQWKRAEKRKLKDEWEDYLSTTTYPNGYDNPPVRIPCFFYDMLGGCDKELVKKYFNDPKLAEKCVFRMFVPGNQLADNYRLEVITTPEDDAVIGWTVIVD